MPTFWIYIFKELKNLFFGNITQTVYICSAKGVCKRNSLSGVIAVIATRKQVV